MPSFRERPVDLVLDVRSRLEFLVGHLDGAVNIPVDRLPRAMSARADVTPTTRILVYCASGGRSAAAATALRGAGYVGVVDGGGIGSAGAEYRAG